MNKTARKIKFIAAFLVAVFAVVFAVKHFHLHDSLNTSQLSSDLDQIGKSEDCSICNYHFTKDIEVPLVAFSLIEPTPKAVFTSFYQNRKKSSIGLSYADRGPPVLFSKVF